MGIAGAVVAGYHSSPGSIAAIAWTAQAVILLGLSLAFGWYRLGTPRVGMLMLVALTAAAGKRAPTVRQAVLIGVLLVGVLTATAGSGGGGAGSRPVLGLALAGASAVANAILLRAVSASATHAHPNFTSGLVALVAAIVSLPALWLAPHWPAKRCRW